MTPGRPLKQPPPDAALRIRELAEEGHNKLGVANLLGTSADTFRRWLDEYPDLKEQYELGRGRQEFALTNVLYRKAMNGDTIAALFLLKARFGWREGEQQDAAASRVNITFQLPGALPMSALPVIDQHGNAIPQPVPLPAPRSDDT
ncbi:MAG: hypothetical protein GC155_06945 [Alphaproteobacteria bacterium]|nr:hypothetical protein [Alphaproteobacteria bacterium]